MGNHISLWWNNLAGSLPNEVGNLTMLSSFNIIGGSISGTIPASLSQCKDMRALGLGHHQLEGEIPDSFATMDKLSFAFFYLNQNLPVSINYATYFTMGSWLDWQLIVIQLTL